MAEPYTPNQTGAIATLLAGALWGLTAIAASTIWETGWTLELTVYLIIVVISWILVPLYIKLVKPAFIVGIIVTTIPLVASVLSLMDPESDWYTFPYPLYKFSMIVGLLVLLATIYFSYKSYRESKKA